MSYQSLGFILFTAVVLLAYYGAGPKRQRWVLAIANLAFYTIAGIQYIPFILVTMLATFCTGRRIGAIYRENDARLAACKDAAQKKQLRADAKKRAKRMLLLGMGITIALLAVCKYSSFAVENVNALLALIRLPRIPMFSMILPLGISFYSFMALSYVLDIYWKRYDAEESFLTYAVYLSYFPHVVQGPIDRFNEFRRQIQGGVAFSYKNFTFGAQLALWGFFKKLVVADRLGIFVDYAFGDWAGHAGITLMAAVAVYSIQIYTDFSGCIDIVAGVSEMLGIRLRRNFNHPYFSRTMGEFWRRWHISLQEWFKDYVYYPVSASALTKKAKKYFKTRDNKRGAELFAACFPIFVVWMITGIWHGADWKYVAWGMFHAMLLIGSRVFEAQFANANRRLGINPDRFAWKLWQMIRTYILCCIGRVFFRAESLGAAIGIFGKMLAPTAVEQIQTLATAADMGDLANLIAGAAAVLLLLAVDILQERMRIRQWLAEKNIALRWLVIFAGLFIVVVFGCWGPGYDAASFIYEQF